MGADAYFYSASKHRGQFALDDGSILFILAQIPRGFGGRAPIRRAGARMRRGETKGVWAYARAER
jgi:hypothetical protein